MLAEPAAPPPAPVPVATPATATTEPAIELPPLDTLKGLESEYKAFMQPDVDPAMRTAALKKLFGDPHFNTMDRLDTYIDDYSIPDPIPAAMLKTLSAARSLGLFDEADEADEKKQAEAAAAPVTAPAPDVRAMSAPEPGETAPRDPVDAIEPEPSAIPRKPEAV
jgi:hypothetical protein